MKLTNSSLKIIAIITMVIDHIGSIIILRLPWKFGGGSLLETVYWMMRYIGRISFPIFCFLLVEGFFHTRNKKKYLFNLTGLAIISEIPFDFAFSGQISFEKQNVFLTLSIGLIMMYVFEKIKENNHPISIKIMLLLITLSISCLFAFVIKSDYAQYGIGVIALMYAFKTKPMVGSVLGCAVLCVMSLTSCPAIFATPFIGMYNGQRGMNLKYVFYFFYPMHLIILYAMSHIIFLLSI